MTSRMGMHLFGAMWLPAMLACVATAAVIVAVPGLTGEIGGEPQGAQGQALTSPTPTSALSADSLPATMSDTPSFARRDSPVAGWADLHNGVVRLAPGVKKLAQRDNPVGLISPAGSVGLILERNGGTRWVLAVEDAGGSSVSSDPAEPGLEPFDRWLATMVALHDDDADSEPGTLVQFTRSGGLTASQRGVTLLRQRRDIDLGSNFAAATDVTAAAQVEYQGKVWYVVARRTDGVAEYVPSTSPAQTLDGFLREARRRYESGRGLR